MPVPWQANDAGATALPKEGWLTLNGSSATARCFNMIGFASAPPDYDLVIGAICESIKAPFLCLSGAVAGQFATGACTVLDLAFSLALPLHLVAGLRLFGSCGKYLQTVWLTAWLAGRMYEAE